MGGPLTTEQRNFLKQISDSYRERSSRWTDICARTLLAIHLTGAVAVLTFLGVMSDLRITPFPWIALGCFSFGVTLMTWLEMKILDRIFENSRRFKDDYGRVFNSEMDYSTLLENEADRNKSTKGPMLWGWIVLLIFLVGLVFSARAVLLVFFDV